MGIALAGNLFTLFLFYELLTFTTWPLVTHRATPEAVRAGRLYLMMLFGASTVLLLPAIAWTGIVGRARSTSRPAASSAAMSSDVDSASCSRSSSSAPPRRR